MQKKSTGKKIPKFKKKTGSGTMSYQIILEFEARGKLATLILKDTPPWAHMGVLGLMEHGIHIEKNSLHDPDIQRPMSHPPLPKKTEKRKFSA